MKNNILITALTVLVVLSSSMWYGAKKQNHKLETDIKKESVKNDSVSAANSSLVNTGKKLNNRIDSLSKINGELNQSITVANEKIARESREVTRARKNNDENTKKLQAWQASQKEWENKLKDMHSANEKLQQQNNQLLAQMVSLTETNHQLNDQLNRAKLAAKDNLSVEALTKHGKPHAKAKKIKTIAVSFTTPNELNSPTFQIFDPNGTLLPEHYGKFQYKIDHSSQSGAGVMKLELTYLLSKRIGKGLYRIEIMNENKHVGNLFVRFR